MIEYLELVGGLAFATIIVAEILLFVRKKSGLKIEIYTAVTILLLMIGWFFYFSASDYARENEPLLLLLVNIILVLVPIAIFLVANEFHAKSGKQWIAYLSAAVVAIVVATVYPIFALYVSCYTGLDCM